MPLRFQPTRGSPVLLIAQTLYSLRETVTTGWTTVSTATYAVLTTDQRLWVTANPCTITFPLSATMNHDVLIKDAAGGAATNNIHNVFSGGQTCDGLADEKITSNYGFIILSPKPVGSGYTKTG